MATIDVTMKLLVDKSSNKVMFAEAGKECVDFLFHILSLPLGTVIRLLNKKQMVGSISNLYQSIENLNETYFQPNQTKEMILQPKLPVSPASIPFLTLKDNAPITQKDFYQCSNSYHNSSCNKYVTDGPNVPCLSCNNTMSVKKEYVAPPGANTSSLSEDGGIVKGVVTYMVMDNLEVKPMSTISSITLLNQFNVKEVCALQELEVTLTMDKALKLLKSSLKSNTVLTDVFLP